MSRAFSSKLELKAFSAHIIMHIAILHSRNQLYLSWLGDPNLKSLFWSLHMYHCIFVVLPLF